MKKLIDELIKSKIETLQDLDGFKRHIAKKLRLPTISNVDLIKAYHKIPLSKRSKILENLLIKKRVRSISGVAVVSVLTKAYPCPGRCIYCPTEKGMPKSYLSNEPAVMRAILNHFDPYKQTSSRLKALKLAGHNTDKVELIVIGGTWSYLPRRYQSWFIKRCFEACNEKKDRTLLLSQKRNEKAKHRIVGLTLETRPDYIDKNEINFMRKLGATRVELGVQSTYDGVLELNKRGHGKKEIITATRLLKKAGFKICYHLMPNLYGSSIEKDLNMFKEIFESEDFKPDLIKIYPCAIIKGTGLYKKWKEGEYSPYTERELIDLLKEIKKVIPRYCRIQRLIRDIPSYSIETGPAKISNMRQILEKEAKKEGWKCKCIRCREIKEDYDKKEKLFLFRENYDASLGKEIFLSYENKNQEKLYSLLRLRIEKDSAIIREIHTYGQLHSLLRNKKEVSPQHKGLGKKLIKEAEKITKKEFKINKISVISGIGVR
ncbi:MAG: tRNA uridine(34) 5-carboxymethylaminomethyl modification radical SAM/GNAT enzyme Elp3, partial [Candidatus Nanoarchaeia archaeon]|nr:tRNA uridine(34) 5-carboxymethylaminomethyl modification radical SAM/GNAT enzyme Elp3 [Candidatus Nanoarchaeia archaeon]